MTRIKGFIQNNSTVVLGLGIVVGLVFPQLANVPSHTVPFMLAIVILLSCAKIKGDDLKAIDFKHSVLFYTLRFLAFPVALGAVFHHVYFPLRDGVLLLALSPAGSSLPAWNALLGGNVSLGMGLLVLSSFLAPFVIPLAFGFVDMPGIDLDLQGIFLTLAAMIFIPVIVYFSILRRMKPINDWLFDNGSIAAIILLAVIVAIVISSQREYFFVEPLFLMAVVVLGCVLYSLFFAIGWLMGLKQSEENRITYALCSGANNLALAISIAYLYFPQPVVHFLILNEIAWLAGIGLFQTFLQHRAGR